MDHVVVTHPEMGVYLGNCLGLAFWSALDSVGQTETPVFADENEARSFVQTWDDHEDIYSLCEFVSIRTENDRYATIDELKSAGLTHLLGDMENNLAAV